MVSTSVFVAALLEFLTIEIAAHSACRATSPLAVICQIHASHVSSGVLGADEHLRRRSPGMTLKMKSVQKARPPVRYRHTERMWVMWVRPDLGPTLHGEG